MSQPLTRFSKGKIQVSVWENEGKNGPYCNVRINKRYQDPKSGEWKDSNSFFASELVTLRELLGQTSEFLEKGFDGSSAPSQQPAPAQGQKLAKV